MSRLKCNSKFTKEGYGLPDIKFWAHMRSQISKPMLLCTWLSTNRDLFKYSTMGAQWLSGRALDSRPKGRGFEPHLRHCVVVLEQDTFILA